MLTNRSLRGLIVFLLCWFGARSAIAALSANMDGHATSAVLVGARLVNIAASALWFTLAMGIGLTGGPWYKATGVIAAFVLFVQVVLFFAAFASTSFVAAIGTVLDSLLLGLLPTLVVTVGCRRLYNAANTETA
jgi:Mg2+/Co2+ transporter CorB